MGRLLALIGALIAAALIAWASERTPEPKPATAPASAFSAERAMADVRQMAREPHPLGSPANHRVRDYLVGRMAALGLSPQVRPGEGVSFRADPERAAISGGYVENIVGVLPGRDRAAPALALMAHYDSVPGSPGAADDAVGVSSALEIVRAIKARGTPARDVMLLITDGEESGLLGADAFFSRDPLAKRVGVLFNMEARGNSGRVQMFETSSGNAGLIDLFRRTGVRPASSSLSTFVYENMPNGTDFTEAKEKGVPGLNYAFLGEQFDYHSPTSTPANLNQGSLQDMGDQVLAAAGAAAFDPALPAKGENRVYSQVFGNLLIAYPPVFGWLVLAAAVALIILGVRRARNVEPFPWTDMLRGAGALLFAVLGSAAVLQFARRATGAGLGYFDQRVLLAQVSRWEAAAFLLALGFLVWAACELARGRRNIALVPLAAGLASSAFGGPDAMGAGLGVAAAVLGFFVYSRPVNRPGAWAGVLTLGAVLAGAAQAAAPLTAYAVTWPLLLAAIGSAASASAAHRQMRHIAILGLLAALGLGWIAGTAHILFLSLDLPQLLAGLVALCGLLIWPLAQPEEGAPPARLVGPLLAGVGFALLLAVRLNSPWDARHPQASHVVYELDQDTGRAWRDSLYVGRTPWTTRALQADGGKIAPRKHWLDRKLESAPARAVALPAPSFSLAKEPDGSLRLTATPPVGARELTLQLRSNTVLSVEQVGSTPVRVSPKPGTWMRFNWEAAPGPIVLRLKPGGPGALDLRYAANTDGWPAGVAPLPPRPAAEMAFHNSDSTLVTGTRRLAW